MGRAVGHCDGQKALAAQVSLRSYVCGQGIDNMMELIQEKVY